MGYEKELIRTLEKMLKDARKKQLKNTTITLPKPRNHTKDYDTSVKMLEWCVEDEIMITRANYENFVLDKWSWTGAFPHSSGLYCGD